MKYCSTCGAELHDNAVICPKCGCMTADNKNQLTDENSPGLNVLSFFIPLVGFILYFVYKSEKPKRAKGCGKWALISFITTFTLNILILLIGMGS